MAFAFENAPTLGVIILLSPAGQLVASLPWNVVPSWTAPSQHLPIH
jgi:hypothetical protein